jgi:hypothetical protein
MPDVALITSTYRSELYLESYTRNVIALAKKCHEAGVALELVVVANAPSAAEQQALERLHALAAPAGLTVTLARVPQETVYASWNRGISLASAPLISFWGVDDTRYAPAILEGRALLQGACDVVYFAYEVRTTVDWGWFRTTDSTLYPARPFDARLFASKMSLGPFWMTSRAFYQRVGPFDEHFRVCGDFEWAHRALRLGHFCPAQQVGGRFVVHGSNLSANTNPQKIVEENVIFLRYSLPDNLRPADPQLMRQTWEGWAGSDHPLPPATADWLWGEGAHARQEAWLLQWQARQRRDNLLRLPRRLVDAVGLRPALARLGLLRSSAR